MLLQWDWSGDDTPGYVWRATGGPHEKYERIGKVDDLRDLTFTDETTLKAGTIYCYTVCAAQGGKQCSKVKCGIAK